MLELYLQAKNFIYHVKDFFNEQHVKKYLEEIRGVSEKNY